MDAEEFDTERLPSRHPWLLSAALLLVLAVFAGPPIAARLTAPAAPSPSVAIGVAPPPVVPPTPAPLATAVIDASTGPPAARPALDARLVDCIRVAREDCLAIARAAASIVPSDSPPVSRVDVYASLLCDSSLDCPPPMLIHAMPLGSAVISFATGGRQAWVDVIDLRYSGGHRPEAWIDRWVDDLSAVRSHAPKS